MDERTDRELLEAIRSGDRGAGEAFARRHAGWAVDYARRKGAGDYAEDVAQHVLGNLLARPPLSLKDSSARAYMATCIVRRIKEEDTARIRAYKGAVPLDEHATSPSSVAARRQAVENVAGHLGELATARREVFVLRYVDGLEPTEIAKKTGRPAGTVRSDLSRIAAFLRSKIVRP